MKFPGLKRGRKKGCAPGPGPGRIKAARPTTNLLKNTRPMRMRTFEVFGGVDEDFERFQEKIYD